MAAEPAADGVYFYIADCEFNPLRAFRELRCNGVVLVVDMEKDELRD